MSFLSPLWLGAGALVGPLVLWYLLRSRRPRRVIASTLLFADEHETVSAAIPWQPFTPDRTFWLIGLAVLLGAVGLARPAVAVPADVSDHTIVVIDGSASMGAVTDDGRARIEVARARAADLIDRAGDGRLVSIVVAGTHARVLADTLPAGQASRALDGLSVSGTRGAMADALTLAAALIRPGEDTVMHLLTDGGIADDAAALAPRGTILTLIGDDVPNVAIGALRATRLGPSAARLLIQVDSFADLAADVRVTVRGADGTLATRAARVDPHGRTDVSLEVDGLTGPSPVLEVDVALDQAGPDGAALVDGLASDNRARVVLPEHPDVRVLHAGPENLFLDAAIGAVPGVTVDRRPSLPATLADVDLVIADRVPLPAALTVPVLAIAPTALPDGATVTGRREAPTITRIASDDPLLADADLSDLAVAAMDVVDAPALRPLVDGPGGPLVLSGRIGGSTMVLLPFALADSNLPLQVALPVLVSNVVQRLAAPPADVPLVAGADRTLPLAEGVEAVLTSPNGAAVAVGGARPSASLDVPGVWRLTVDGEPPSRGPAVLAVNPDVGESDLDVVEPPLAVAAADPEEDEGSVAPRLALAGDTALRTDGRVELWRWFLLAATALVLAELVAQARAERGGRRRAAAVPASRAEVGA